MLAFLRPKLRDGWMAVAYASGRLQLAHVRRRRGSRPEVLLVHSRPLAQDEAATLKALRQDLDLDCYHCTALLQAGEYQFLQIESPEFPGEDPVPALRERIKDLLGFPAEAASIDALEIPREAGVPGRERQVFAVAANNALLAPRVAAFDKAGLRLEAIDIGEAAQRNIAALFETEDSGLALLSFDDRGGTLSFTRAGELYAVRHIEAPLAQFASSDGQRRSALFERVALETQRSLDNFERQHGHVGIARLLLAAVPDGSDFLASLRDYLTVPVAELDLAEVLDLSRVPELALPSCQTEYLKVVGAALRDPVAAGDPS